MKVILEDFNYKGQHFDYCKADLPQINDLSEIPEGKLEEYITESLNEHLEFVNEDEES